MNSLPVVEYLASAEGEHPEIYKRLKEYKLDEGVVKELKAQASKAVIVVFSAVWCPDCRRNAPILGAISEATGLEVMVFGNLMRDAKSSTEIWRIPPSPQEVKEFNVKKIPLIIVLNKKGQKLGEIVEDPPPGKTLEQAVNDLLKRA